MDEHFFRATQVQTAIINADLKAGMQVELVIERAYDLEDVEHTMWKWKPLAA